MRRQPSTQQEHHALNFNTKQSAEYTLYSIHYEVYNEKCIMYTVYSIVYSVQCIMYIVQSIVYSVHCIVYRDHCKTFMQYCIVFTVVLSPPRSLLAVTCGLPTSLNHCINTSPHSWQATEYISQKSLFQLPLIILGEMQYLQK